MFMAAMMVIMGPAAKLYAVNYYDLINNAA